MHVCPKQLGREGKRWRSKCSGALRIRQFVEKRRTMAGKCCITVTATCNPHAQTWANQWSSILTNPSPFWSYYSFVFHHAGVQ